MSMFLTFPGRSTRLGGEKVYIMIYGSYLCEFGQIFISLSFLESPFYLFRPPIIRWIGKEGKGKGMGKVAGRKISVMLWRSKSRGGMGDRRWDREGGAGGKTCVTLTSFHFCKFMQIFTRHFSQTSLPFLPPFILIHSLWRSWRS